jgi:hypothetical protein
MPGIFGERSTVAPAKPEIRTMADYRFSVVIPVGAMTDEDILNTTDALGNAGCTDASIRGHADGMELLFERGADSLQVAISSAIVDVERAGYRVSKIERERDAITI